MERADDRDFEDIISLPHHVSPTRPQMKRIDRAAQFAPFAALNGHSEAMRETARLTQPRIELSEDCRAELDRRQKLLSTVYAPRIRVTFFVPDGHKEGGHYAIYTGKLRRIVPEQRIMVMEDGTVIKLDDVIELDSPLFCNCDMF